MDGRAMDSLSCHRPHPIRSQRPLSGRQPIPENLSMIGHQVDAAEYVRTHFHFPFIYVETDAGIVLGPTLEYAHLRLCWRREASWRRTCCVCPISIVLIHAFY